MQHKPVEPPRQQVESVLRDFGVKPSAKVCENLRRNLEQEREKYAAVERIHGKGRDKNHDKSH
jgi:hypothetical protein